MSDLLRNILDELGVYAEPILVMGVDPEQIGQFLAAAGLNVDALPALDLAALQRDASALGEAIGQLKTAGTPNALADIPPFLDSIGKITATVRSLLADHQPSIPAALQPAWQDMAEQVVGRLAATWLRTQQPTTHTVLTGLGLVGPVAPPHDGVITADGTLAYLPALVDTVNVDRIIGLIHEPERTWSQLLFGAPTPPSGQDAISAVQATLWPQIRTALEASLREVLLGADQAYQDAAGDLGKAGNEVTAATLVIPLGTDTAGATLAITLLPGIAPAAGGAGGGDNRSMAVVSVDGSLALTAALGGPWHLDVTTTGESPLLAVDTAGTVTIDPDSTSLTLTAQVSRDPAGPEQAPLLTVGGSTGTRIALGEAAATVIIQLEPDRPAAVDISVTVTDLTATLDLTDGDSFLAQAAKSILGAPLTCTAEVTLGWAWKHGLYVRGGAHITTGSDKGLRTDLPVNLDAGPVRIPTLHAALTGPASDADPPHVEFTISGDAQLTLGPVVVTVTDIGLTAKATSHPGSGNLGPLTVGLGFKPPSGAGLAVTAPLVSGGGLLSHDESTGRYAGAVALKVGSLTVQGVAILNTRIPGGGWSLIGLANVQGLSVQLGLGLRLTGIGVLVGINRTIDVPALQAKARSGGLQDVIFPPDLAKNAATIIDTLEAVFPTKRGQFVFGPTVQAAWGAGEMLTAELAIYVELPAPIRILLLGSARLTLPTRAAATVDLRLDILGVLDLAARTIALDMSLNHSTLAGMPLTGQAALRAGWGSQSGFTLAAGGFNQHYVPTSPFPALQRITLAMGGGDLTLRLSAYFAVTSNTIQLGARADLRAAGAGAALTACVAFDALIQLSPFQLDIDLHIAAALTFQGVSLLAITIDVHLTGPSPWHLSGKAEFHLLLWSITIPISGTFGATTPAIAAESANPLTELADAVADPASWHLDSLAAAGTPGRSGPAAAAALTISAGTDPTLLHPLGGVRVTQRVAPLNIPIDHIGNRSVHPHTVLTLTLSDSIGVLRTAPATDLFAPAQFFPMSDAQQLASASFEPHDSGLIVNQPPIAVDAADGVWSAAADHTVAAVAVDREWTLTDVFDQQPNLVQNPDFATASTPTPAPFDGQGGAPSAADLWTLWNNEKASTATDLQPTTRPGSSGTMIHVATTAPGCGLVQRWDNAVDAGPTTALVNVWVRVVRGQVRVGAGNGGSINPDILSQNVDTWQLLQSGNGVAPVNEIVIHAHSPGGAEFYVDWVSVRPTGGGQPIGGTQLTATHPLARIPSAVAPTRISLPPEIFEAQLLTSAQVSNGAAYAGPSAFPGPFTGAAAVDPSYVLASPTLHLTIPQAFRGFLAVADGPTSAVNDFPSRTSALAALGPNQQACLRSEIVAVDPALWRTAPAVTAAVAGR